MERDEMLDEAAYDRLRLRQWLAGQARGDAVSRRDLLRLSAGLGLAAVPLMGLAQTAAAAPPAGAGATADAAQAGPIVKPLPPELFTVFGTNAEMRWEAHARPGLPGAGRPVLRPQPHQHAGASTPTTWRLQLFGTGLRGAPTADAPVEFSLRAAAPAAVDDA